MCYDGLSHTQKCNGNVSTGNAKSREASSRVSEPNFLEFDRDLSDTLFRGCNYQGKDCTFHEFQIALRLEGKMLLGGLSIFLLLHLAYS